MRTYSVEYPIRLRYTRHKMHKRIIILVLVSLVMAGCKTKSDNQIKPTPTPAGKAETVKVGVEINPKIASMIEGYLEAQVFKVGDESGTPVGSAVNKKMNHTKGLPNRVELRLTAIIPDENQAYILKLAIYNNEKKEVILYRGKCSNPTNCLVLTLGNPNKIEMTLEAATNEDNLYANSVPENLRKQCGVKAETTNCKRPVNRIYYDATANTCKRFSWGGCGEVAPFSNITLCQQACIK